MMRFVLTTAALLLAAIADHAQTAWSDYIHVLKADVSDSPISATLPPDVKITPPSRDLSAARASWERGGLGMPLLPLNL